MIVDLLKLISFFGRMTHSCSRELESGGSHGGKTSSNEYSGNGRFSVNKRDNSGNLEGLSKVVVASLQTVRSYLMRAKSFMNSLTSSLLSFYQP